MRNVWLYYMSAQLPPDPILTTYQYWNWLNVDEATRRQRALDNTYMTFPTVQNYPTFFSKLFLITDATLTKMANTAYVYSALLSTMNTWTGLNTFGSIDTGAITTNTITATTLALSGTQLDTPLTPFYSYPVGTFTGNNTPPIGTAGTIGFIPATTWITNGTGGGAGISVRRVDLTAGVWIVAGTTRLGAGTQGSCALAITTAQNGGTSLGRKGTWQYTSGQPTLPAGMGTIITISTPSALTLFLTQRNDTGFPIDYSAMVAIRIA